MAEEPNAAQEQTNPEPAGSKKDYSGTANTQAGADKASSKQNDSKTGSKPNDSNAARAKQQKIDLVQLIPTLIYGVIALAILGLIGWGLAGKGGFLAELRDKEVARGLITFLIAVTTVGIAVILAISTLFGADGGEGDKRFDRGKQVLSVLIGVLGTIVGFYFGSSQDNKTGQTQNAVVQPQALTIAPPALSDSQPKQGKPTTISSFIFGGKKPYVYSITFDNSAIPAIKDIKSPDGSIKQEVVVPETLAADTEVKFQIDVTDGDNKTAQYKDGAQKISVKAK